MTQDPCELFTFFYFSLSGLPDLGVSEILEPLLKFSFLDHDGGLID